MAIVRTTVSLTCEDKTFVDDQNLEVSKVLRDSLDLLRKTQTKTMTAALAATCNGGAEK